MFSVSRTEEEVVHIYSYCLPSVDIKMFRVDDFTYLVTQTSKLRRESKCLVCMSKEHADFIFDACVEKVRPWVN